MSEESKFFTVGDADEFDPQKWADDGIEDLPNRHPETHIDVLIVGAGYGGLMTACECWRKGHNVVGILERNAGPNYSGKSLLSPKPCMHHSFQPLTASNVGDLIYIQPPGIGILRHWPGMARELEQDRIEAPTYYYKHNGELIYGPSDPTFNDSEYLAERKGLPYVAPVQIRKNFYRMLLRQVARLGLKVDYNQQVDRYLEDESAGVGGVVLKGGATKVAHVVVAADGSKSRADLFIAGEHVPVQSSGMSVFRTAFPGQVALQDDLISKRWGPNGTAVSDAHEFWMGPGMHMGLYVSPQLVAFGLTIRDEHLLQIRGSKQNGRYTSAPTGLSKVVEESWNHPDVNPADVLDVLHKVPGWHPAIEALVKSAPQGTIIHWPLTWRNLRRNWTSKGGRVVQIGDAAHTTIPASLSGGTLAIEDAITLAACLQLSSSGGGAQGNGGAGVPLGTSVYNLLRYQRASCIQKMAFVNAQLLHHTNDWEAIRQNPEKIQLRFPRWIFRHDPEAYAYEKYGQAFLHLVAGDDFKNTNYPPGHEFVPWTIADIQRDVAAGKKLEHLLDGDWS